MLFFSAQILQRYIAYWWLYTLVCDAGRRDIGPYRRREGGSDNQLRAVSEARIEEFVGTRRLEDDWPGYSWRSALSPGYFRLPLPRPRAYADWWLPPPCPHGRPCSIRILIRAHYRFRGLIEMTTVTHQV
jgi:hypothetical protein